MDDINVGAFGRLRAGEEMGDSRRLFLCWLEAEGQVMTPSPENWRDAAGSPNHVARAVAEKTLARLRQLNEQFPSQELADAIKKLEAWRKEYLRDERPR
jgi:hypothetical protein